MNIFELFGVIAINNSEANKSIDDTNNRAGALAKGFKAAGRVAGTMGKAIVTGVGVGAAAMGALMKSSTQAYAQYEQLSGGSKLLFGDAYDYIAEKAATAYKDVQMNQNDYLTQVNGLATGLKKSMGGNEQAAAELAHNVIQAEADVVAATGQTQEEVQNAFNGIMKNNFTMLDNLGLGITPTKQGFQKLIKEVNAWNKANGNATKYNIKNLADCQAALVDYIEMQGLAGYASMEASETISGSLASASAAWTNLLIGISDGNQDLGELVDNFVDSGVKASKNIIKILPNMVQGVRGMIDGIAPEIPAIVQEIFPALLDGAIALIGGLAQALPGLLAVLGDTLSTVWANNVWPAIQDFFKIKFGVELPDWSVIGPQLEKDVSGIMENLGKAGENAGSFFTDLYNVLESVSTWISQNEPLVKAFLGALFVALLLVNAPLTLIGGAIVLLIANWDSLKAAAIACWDGIVAKWNVAAGWFDKNITQPLKQGWEEIKQWVEDTKTAVTNFLEMSPSEKVQALFNMITSGWNAISDAISTAASTLAYFLGLSSGRSSAVHTSSSGETHGGGGGKSFGSTVVGAGSAIGEYLGIKGAGAGSAATEVKFRAKGAIFKKATIFDTRLGLQGVGEAGEEAVAPISVLRQYVREEVAAVNNENARQMQGMREDFRQFMGELPDMLAASFASMKFDVNNREFARLVKAVT